MMKRCSYCRLIMEEEYLDSISKVLLFRTFKLNWAFQNKNRNEYSVFFLFTQLYICNLDESVDEKFLRSYLSFKYRSVSSVKIMIDFKTNQSKGYGFVKFLDSDEYERALSELNGRILRNKIIRVK